MTADRRAALGKAAMLVLIKGSGRITQELWADVLTIISLIRAETLEEAARVADDYEGKGMDGGYDSHLGDAFRTRRDIAAAIRDLAGQYEGCIVAEGKPVLFAVPWQNQDQSSLYRAKEPTK